MAFRFYLDFANGSGLLVCLASFEVRKSLSIYFFSSSASSKCLCSALECFGDSSRVTVWDMVAKARADRWNSTLVKNKSVLISFRAGRSFQFITSSSPPPEFSSEKASASLSSLLKKSFPLATDGILSKIKWFYICFCLLFTVNCCREALANSALYKREPELLLLILIVYESISFLFLLVWEILGNQISVLELNQLLFRQTLKRCAAQLRLFLGCGDLEILVN